MALIEDYPRPTTVQVAHWQEGLHQRLLERAAYLRPQDQAVLQHALHGTVSCRQLAKLLNIPAGTLSRRLRRLANRLYDPLVVALIEKPGNLRGEYRQLGLEHFLHGFSAIQLADRHQISAAEVRKMLEYIRGWHRGRSERT